MALERKRRQSGLKVCAHMAIAAAVLGLATAVHAGQATRAVFGTLPDGETVEAITLTNSHGLSATVITYGASLQAMITPDRTGRMADITLGYARLQSYLDQPQYFGATVGRFANRIARGRFTLNGRTYQTPVNNGQNALHGGDRGFDKVNWKVASVTDGPSPHVVLTYVSPDGDMGYPGQLTVKATYQLDDTDALTIRYEAETTADTIVNITNHAYWNLAGEGSSRSINDQRLTLHADAYLPTDAGAIPTGEIRPVAGTVFDFRTPAAIGQRVRDASDPQIAMGRGYDHNWVVSRTRTAQPRRVAEVSDPVSGRRLVLSSDQPGVQFYSGNFLDGTTSGKSGHAYRQGDAFALEPQLFPDTPNRPSFGSARLRPGEVYSNALIFQFSAR
jgi:aldose 1-epimerase